MRVDDVAGNGPGIYCSPRHRMPFNSRNEGSKRVLATWLRPGNLCCGPTPLNSHLSFFVIELAELAPSSPPPNPPFNKIFPLHSRAFNRSFFCSTSAPLRETSSRFRFKTAQVELNKGTIVRPCRGRQRVARYGVIQVQHVGRSAGDATGHGTRDTRHGTRDTGHGTLDTDGTK